MGEHFKVKRDILHSPITYIEYTDEDGDILRIESSSKPQKHIYIKHINHSEYHTGTFVRITDIPMLITLLNQLKEQSKWQ